MVNDKYVSLPPDIWKEKHNEINSLIIQQMYFDYLKSFENYLW